MIIGYRVESSTAGVLDETVESDLNVVIVDPVGDGITKKGARCTKIR